MKRILVLSAAFILMMGGALTAQVEKSKPTKLVRKNITVKAVADKNEIKAEGHSGSTLVKKRLNVTTHAVVRKTKKR